MNGNEMKGNENKSKAMKANQRPWKQIKGNENKWKEMKSKATSQHQYISYIVQ